MKVHHNGMSSKGTEFGLNLYRYSCGKMGKNSIKAFYVRCYDERKNWPHDIQCATRSDIHGLFQNPLEIKVSIDVCKCPLSKVIYNFQQLLTPKQLEIYFITYRCAAFLDFAICNFMSQSNNIAKRNNL